MRSALITMLLAIPLLSSCTKQQLGIPRIQTTFVSPDGHYVAELRNHLAIDPPEQSLWIGEVGGRMHALDHVASDTTWDGPIAWSPDSSVFAFIAAGAELVAARPSTGKVVFRRWLIDRGDCGRRAKEEIRHLTLVADGSAAITRICRKRSASCSEWQLIALTMSSGGV